MAKDKAKVKLKEEENSHGGVPTVSQLRMIMRIVGRLSQKEKEKASTRASP